MKATTALRDAVRNAGADRRVNVVVAAYRGFNDDKAFRLASAIAYSAIFSIAPLFVVLIALVGHILDVHGGSGGSSVAENALIERIRSGAGADAADTVKHLVEAAYSKPHQGLVASIIAWCVFSIGAAGLFASLQDALNAIWHVDVAGGWRQMVRDRVSAFVMIVVVGALLIASFIAAAVLSFALSHLPQFFSLGGFAQHAIDLGARAINLALGTMIFAAIFKILPDVHVPWRSVWRGAFATSLLFTIGEAAIATYFAYAGVTSAYGAAGSLLVVLLWIYYSALILIFGAEFTKVDAARLEAKGEIAPVGALAATPEAAVPRA